MVDLFLTMRAKPFIETHNFYGLEAIFGIFKHGKGSRIQKEWKKILIRQNIDLEKLYH